jgi:hypothetical protein
VKKEREGRGNGESASEAGTGLPVDYYDSWPAVILIFITCLLGSELKLVAAYSMETGNVIWVWVI